MEKIPTINNILDRKKLFLILDIMKKMVLENQALPNIIKNIRSGSDREKTKREISSIIKSILDSVEAQASDTILYLQSTLSLNENWLPLFVEEFVMKYLTGRRDLHTNNLGVNQNGYIRYFDSAEGSPDKELWIGTLGRKDPDPNAGTIVPGEEEGTKVEKLKPSVNIEVAQEEGTKVSIPKPSVKASRSDKLLALSSKYYLLTNK